MFITRGISKTKKNCTCRLFMESEAYCTGDDAAATNRIRNDLVKAWNRRTPNDTGTEGKAL